MSQAQLDRGYRLVELLKQGLNSPMAVEHQIISLYAGTRGFLDPIPVVDVRRFESELIEYFSSRHGDLVESIRTSGAIADTAAFEAGIKEFADRFAPSDGAATGA